MNEIRVITAILGSVGIMAVIYMLAVLARFSQKLGAVTKMRPFYYGYYVAIGCLVVAVIAHFARASVFWASPSAENSLLGDPWFYFLAHHLPMAVAMLISLAITWHYWKWLLKER